MTQTRRRWMWFMGLLAAIVGLFLWLGTTAEHLFLGWLYFPSALYRR